MNKKKKIIIIISAIIAALAIIIGLIIVSTSPVSKKDEKVLFVVETGTSKVDIIDSLKDAGLIKSTLAGYGYVFLGNSNLQAGRYMLNRNMSLGEIIGMIKNGKTYHETIEITFVEGKRLLTYVDQMVETFGFKKEDILNTLSNKEYLNTLIDKYWFLTDEILNKELYYPLEGYLYPAKYEFYKETSIEIVIEKMLDSLGRKLESLKEEIEKSEYSVHEVLAMASIIELEAVTSSDREKVSQVIYRRLEKNWSLGMDVTSYYGVQKEMGETLYKSDLNDDNPYNTRPTNKLGLPVGAICNPSFDSINAVFNPTDTDYMYFYADIKTGLVYFARTSGEFNELIKEFGG